MAKKALSKSLKGTIFWISRNRRILRWKVDVPLHFRLALENNLKTGACGGSCACSTCHVIVETNDYYDKIPEPDDDENDMLDLAFGLTETSRLGCQVKMSRKLDGLRVRLPSMTRNLQASDFSGAKKA